MQTSTLSMLLVALLLLCPGKGWAETRLDQMKEKYRTAVSAAAAESTARVTALNEKYLVQLKKLEEQYRAAADLDHLIAVKAEQKRFTRDPSITQLDLGGPGSALHTLQQAYQSRRDGLEVEEARHIVTITQQYQKGLQALQVELTRTGSILEATAVRNTREALTLDQKYQWALDKRAAAERHDPSGKQADKKNPGEKEKKFSARKMVTIRGARLSADWTTIPISIVPGDVVSITTSGSWSPPHTGSTCGPEGLPEYQSSYYRRRSPDFPYGALLMRIGNKGRLRQVNPSLSFTAAEKGILYFDANVENDRRYRKDARGEILVSVEVVRHASRD